MADINLMIEDLYSQSRDMVKGAIPGLTKTPIVYEQTLVECYNSSASLLLELINPSKDSTLTQLLQAGSVVWNLERNLEHLQPSVKKVLKERKIELEKVFQKETLISLLEKKIDGSENLLSKNLKAGRVSYALNCLILEGFQVSGYEEDRNLEIRLNVFHKAFEEVNLRKAFLSGNFLESFEKQLLKKITSQTGIFSEEEVEKSVKVLSRELLNREGYLRQDTLSFPDDFTMGWNQLFVLSRRNRFLSGGTYRAAIIGSLMEALIVNEQIFSSEFLTSNMPSDRKGFQGHLLNSEDTLKVEEMALRLTEEAPVGGLYRFVHQAFLAARAAI